jgi:hypothetical protein
MFKSDLCLTALTPDLWALASPLVFVGTMGTVTAPKGVITDLASIPKVIDWIPFLDRTGISRRAGALHDWAYMGLRANGKDWCDNLLREALMSEGMSATEAGIYFKAVQLFGAKPWENDGNRHPYASGPSNLEDFDFVTQEDYQAWLATSPKPNE